MQNTTHHNPPLAEYVDLKTTQEKLGKGNFPTLDSLRWFVRRNRDRLAASGAMIMVAGRQKFHPELTEEVVVETGRRAALGECDE